MKNKIRNLIDRADWYLIGYGVLLALMLAGAIVGSPSSDSGPYV